jgi:molybdopterin biosynthesis enzyme
MPRSTVVSYVGRVSTTPPVEQIFPVAGNPAAALSAARDWVEDQVRSFLEQHPLPHDFWHAGMVFAGAREEGRYEQPTAELTLHTESGEYVFEWSDVD